MHLRSGRLQSSSQPRNDMSDLINVEVVFGPRESQALVSVSMRPGSTVADALEASAIAAAFPDTELKQLPVGIWGHPVERDRLLADGDRVEIYRELAIDPKESRRLRALDQVPDPCESR